MYYKEFRELVPLLLVRCRPIHLRACPDMILLLVLVLAPSAVTRWHLSVPLLLLLP